MIFSCIRGFPGSAGGDGVKLLIIIRLLLAGFEMSYPLSTRSSKKSKKTPDASSSVLLQRSACQNSKPETLRPEQYRNILVGQRVFIQLYYQGRVISTAYNEWIPFMGGILSKRLIPKVTIFLTNLEEHEIGGVRERVRKICPQCRIVNILWFQQCYQQKQKIPFEEYALDLEADLSQQHSEDPKDENEQKEINQLLTNIAEDADLEFKQFFKNERCRFFEPLLKNNSKTEQQIIAARDIDLGQNPNKKLKPKNDNKKRRKSFSRQIKPDTILVQQPRESKSMGQEMLNPNFLNEEQGDSTESILRKETEDKKTVTLENIMSKYLGGNNSNKIQGQQENPNQAKKQTIVKVGNSQARSKQRGELYRRVERQPPRLQANSQLIATVLQGKRYREKENHRLTLSVLGTKYKNINLEEDINSFTPYEIQRSISALTRRDQNCLIVLTPSHLLEQKIEEINLESNHHSAILLHKINIKHFAAISQQIQIQKDAFFLLNPKKATERALFYALKSQTAQSKLRLRLISYRLIEQVIAYNNQIKVSSLRTPIKLQKNRLKFIKQLFIKADSSIIRGKKVAFLQSELPIITQKKLIELFGGEYIFKQDYLLSANLDIIITDRWGLKERGIQTIKEQEFWRKVFKLEGEL